MPREFPGQLVPGRPRRGAPFPEAPEWTDTEKPHPWKKTRAGAIIAPQQALKIANAFPSGKERERRNFLFGYNQIKRFYQKRAGVNGIPRWWVHILLVGQGFNRRIAGQLTLMAEA